MSSRLPSTKSLQIFLVTARQLNLTRSAEILNITQGAVSRQIKMLEERLETQLFHRKARGLTLTTQGEKFIPHAEDIIARIRKSVLDMSSHSETIKLNAPSCITSWLLPKLMEFQKYYPDIKVELTSTITHFVAPDFDVFDATIIYGQASKSSLIESQLLFKEQLSPVCTANIMQQIDASKTDKLETRIAQFTWLHANVEQTDWKTWLNHWQIKGISSKTNQHFQTLDQAMNAAIQGFGIAIGDIKLAEQDLKAQRLVRLYDEAVSTGMGYYLVRPKNIQHPLLPKLLEMLTTQ
ncbi:LysR substrate-binding domain-containing protein [Vibrio sp. MA40-2]|uniref:LysR substrate-binding domain-containing protein n=1 Tax=Vibrio sp. MA40-2 TaxID=3391828 RepID=UPI0039A5F60F